MKKKLLVVGVLMTLALWMITDRSPIQLLISFLAAGALPVVPVSFNPYIMFGLAFVGGIALIKALSMDIRLPLEEEEPEAHIKSLKITANTHRRRTSTPARKHKSSASAKKRRRSRNTQQRSKQLKKQLAS